MQRALGLFKLLLALLVSGAVGLTCWLAIARPELLPLASAYTAKIVCSNVIIAKRNADEVVQTDVQIALHHVAWLMNVDVDIADRSDVAVSNEPTAPWALELVHRMVGGAARRKSARLSTMA